MRQLTAPELHRMSPTDFKNSEKLPVSLLLENVRSLHNVGSIFRTADAFCLSQLYITGFTGCPPHREIHRSALGAEDTVAWVHHSNPLTLVHSLKQEGHAVFAVEITSQSIPLDRWEWGFDRPLTLVLGNEVEGVSPGLLELCDASVEIPQGGTKHSLNVSVCGGVVGWEMYRRWTKRGGKG
ncbi:MAG: RNA methyltransferase [Sphingomonadales bacterium]|nr:RNA methyltransferase [Sphingomonadales bacterium]